MNPSTTVDFTSTVTCNTGLYGPSLADACSAPTFFLFMSLLNSLISSNDVISGICERVVPIERPDSEYDFIVIGGGAAGSVVTGRLSENSSWKVLLLEAGGDEPAGAEVPGFVATFLGTKLNWNYKTTNESHACLARGGSCSWPSGKNLGGNTAHHHMVYLRGNPTDYNNWAAQGNPGWAWKDVKPFFLIAENNVEIERVGRTHHATGGPLPVERFPDFPTLGQSFLAAAEEVGYGVSEDLNGDVKTGLSLTQGTSKNGVRYSSASAYLRPVRHRKNLHVSLNSFVTRVIVEHGKATGVEYEKNGELKIVKATREVIISAGAIRSPPVLLHSGIGPKKHLEAVGIEVVKDLPGVGENIHNHVSYKLEFTVNNTDAYENDWEAALRYLTNQTGPMSSTGLAQMVGMLATNTTAPDYPDIEVFFGNYEAGCAPGNVGTLRSTGRRTLSIIPTYLHPKSKGRISLASNDPTKHPVIWGNHLGDSRDVDRLLDGIRMAFALTKTEALRALDITFSGQPIEACSEYEFSTPQYWRCAIHQKANPDNHQAGSCKMGPASDPMAVVDHRLRVHGIHGLRVADASIMPEVTSCNTAAPTMMIGERAAAFIKGDWA